MAQSFPAFEEQKVIAAKWFIGSMGILFAIFLTDFVFSVFYRGMTGVGDLTTRVVIAGFPIFVFLWVKLKDVKLITQIDEEGIAFRWHPFKKQLKTFRWKDIDSVEYITYGFVGYGWRFGGGYDEINNVSGNRGLLVVLKNGSRYLIGTQKTESDFNRLTAEFKGGEGSRWGKRLDF